MTTCSNKESPTIILAIFFVKNEKQNKPIEEEKKVGFMQKKYLLALNLRIKI